MLLLIERSDTTYAATHPGPWSRLTARVFAFKIDHTLAAGARPDSTIALALRAQTLVGDSARIRLAQGFQRLLRVAADPATRHPLDAAAPFRRSRVHAADAELRELIDRLLGPQLVSARGVAQARLLLTDGAGPLYRSQYGDLGPRVSAVIDALDPLR
jgi:hypothetical protein